MGAITFETDDLSRVFKLHFDFFANLLKKPVNVQTIDTLRSNIDLH